MIIKLIPILIFSLLFSVVFYIIAFADTRQLGNGQNLKKLEKMIESEHENRLCGGQLFPYPDDAEGHFAEIHRVLQNWTYSRPHEYTGYKGPWIENWWIKYFSELYRREGLLSKVFGDYIPLLVPWTDRWVNQNPASGKASFRYPAGMIDALKSVIRKNVQYVTVLQSSNGLLGQCDEGLSAKDIDNILVFSAGGYGHIPIPLLKKPEIFRRKVDQNATYFASYLGSMENGHFNFRRKVCDYAIEFAKQNSLNTFLCRKSKHWRNIISRSKFALCPRGYGRTSFLLFEAIQMGVPPIHIYEDSPWLPYEDIWEEFGFSASLKTLITVLSSIKGLSESNVQRRITRLRELRETHFSYEGVMKQINNFLIRKRNDLRCRRLPECRTKNNAPCHGMC